jgi:competence protein ComEA
VATVVPRAASAQPDGAVDLNTASYDELRALDLTITQAKRVIAYRDRSGGFSSLDQLDDVPGFPDEVRAELKRRVRL